MRQSCLPAGGSNVFQLIKAQREAARKSGIKITDLSIGQPTGPALSDARVVCSLEVGCEEQDMHEYQDNSCLPRPTFAREFVQGHVNTDLLPIEGCEVDFLPIPGIKPMLPLIPIACGIGGIAVQGMTNPGYPVPATWCGYLGYSYSSLETTPENKFLFDPTKISPNTKLVMMNYPHNPSGQISSREWLEQVCEVCSKRGIRLFNDSAYTILAGEEHCALTDVAVNYPDLSWAEAFSASKAGNFTGWRVGAIVGSPDFVGDIKSIKGNTDSGFFAPAALGVLIAFQQRGNLKAVNEMYARRIRQLVEKLTLYGMTLAVEPKAGFFTLWMSPKHAFGQKIDSAAHFNQLMIENTGIVGVPFDPYIRYAVVGDVESMLPDIEAGFRKAKVSY